MRRLFAPSFLKTGVLAASSLAVYNTSQKQKNPFCQEHCRTSSNSPSTMKAIRVDQFGDESKLRLVTQNIPRPKDDEVLIRVLAVGVNPVEVMIRNGQFGDLVSTPYTPGTDVAGIVDNVGRRVTKFKKGDRVFGIQASSGSYAEFCTVPADYTAHLDRSLSFSQGAAIGIPYTAAYKALCMRARGQCGETVLIHGASGAVGLAAVQLAKCKGLTVIGTAGTREGMDLVRSQGADYVFNHSECGYMEKIKQATGCQGVNIVLEMLANKNLTPDFGVIAPRGRIVVIGSKGTINHFDPSRFMGIEADIMGMMVQASTEEEYLEMLHRICQGQGQWVNPVIAKEFSLNEVARAHREVERGSNSKGKIVLRPDC